MLTYWIRLIILQPMNGPDLAGTVDGLMLSNSGSTSTEEDMDAEVEAMMEEGIWKWRGSMEY